MDYGKYSPNARRKIAPSTHTPQSLPIPGRESDMVRNAAGGFVFQVGKWDQLQRFLILGSEGGSYYISERELTKMNCKVLDECLAEDGLRVVRMVVDVSENGRALKQDPALYVLAMAAAFKHNGKAPKHPGPLVIDSNLPKADARRAKTEHTAKVREYRAALAEFESGAAVRDAAFAALPKVARTSTALFHWAKFVTQARGGWSRALRTAVANWYESRGLDRLAYQVVKYKQRDGMSHRNLIRLSHAKPNGSVAETLFRHVVKPEESKLTAGVTALLATSGKKKLDLGVPLSQNAFEMSFRDMAKAMETLREGKHTGRSTETMKRLAGDRALLQVAAAEELTHLTGSDAATVKQAIHLITAYSLPREVVPTHLQKNPEIWEALVADMPINAMVRTLNRMTASGLLTDRSDATMKVLSDLKNRDILQNARLHPMQVLIAMKQYAAGRGEKGDLTWKPVQKIVDALSDAFYDTFEFVEPTGKDLLVAVDVSGSMHAKVMGVVNMQAKEAAAAMALVMAATEPKSEVIAFADKLHSPRVSGKMRLDEVMREFARFGGGTDLALPFVYAKQQARKTAFNAVLSLTDDETWAGRAHALEVLADVRRRDGMVLAVNCATAANRATGLDPKYKGVLEVSGFDAALPTLVNEFLKGNV